MSSGGVPRESSAGGAQTRTIGDQTFARSAEAWRPAYVALQVRERTVDVVNPAQFASIDINPRDIRPQEADR